MFWEMTAAVAVGKIYLERLYTTHIGYGRRPEITTGHQGGVMRLPFLRPQWDILSLRHRNQPSGKGSSDAFREDFSGYGAPVSALEPYMVHQRQKWLWHFGLVRRFTSSLTEKERGTNSYFAIFNHLSIATCRTHDCI